MRTGIILLASTLFQLIPVFLIVDAQTASLSPTPVSALAPSPPASNEPRPSPSKSPFPFAFGRLFSISTDAPIRATLHRNPQFISGHRRTQSYIEAVEAYIIHSFTQVKDHTSSTALVPCNSQGSFKTPFQFYSEIRHLPIPDISCLTEFVISDNKQSNILGMSLQELHQAAHNRSKAIFLNRKRIADAVMGNWTDPDALHDSRYNESQWVCEVNNAAAIRVGPKWYIRTMVTSRPAYENVYDLQRQLIYEYLRIDATNPNEFDDALLLKSPIRPPDGSGPHLFENRTTTILESKGGLQMPITYGRIYFEQIPAVRAALALAEQSDQQANDALTPSSISILVLPLVLNIVPLAALMPSIHVSSMGAFIYTLITDIFTVIPLIIKGSELIIIGNTPYTAASVRISSGTNGSLAKSSSAELWTSKCHMRPRVSRIGIAFVVAGVVVMIVGVALEFLAKWCYDRQLRSAASAEGIHILDTEEYFSNWIDVETSSEETNPPTACNYGEGKEPRSLLSPNCDLLELNDDPHNGVYSTLVVEDKRIDEDSEETDDTQLPLPDIDCQNRLCAEEVR